MINDSHTEIYGCAWTSKNIAGECEGALSLETPIIMWNDWNPKNDMPPLVKDVVNGDGSIQEFKNW